MENKKLLVLLLLLGGGYLVWKNSKPTATAPTGNGTGSTSTGTSEYGTGEVITGSEYAPSDFPQSQKDCPEGTLFSPMNCITTPCLGGSCVPIEVAVADLPVKPEPKLVPDYYGELVNPYGVTDAKFGGFSFVGSDENTLALQGNLKQGLVKQSNFN